MTSSFPYGILLLWKLNALSLLLFALSILCLGIWAWKSWKPKHFKQVGIWLLLGSIIFCLLSFLAAPTLLRGKHDDARMKKMQMMEKLMERMGEKNGDFPR